MKKLINVTDITSYLYCPRKLWLKIKGIREPQNKKMIQGMIKHKIFDIFNKNEPVIVSSVTSKLDKKQIKQLYLDYLAKITKETCINYQNMLKSFFISEEEILKSVLKFMDREIELRTESISLALNSGFLGKELWRELKPKYLTEFEITSFELGLKGRIDRIKLQEEILPYEIKTQEEIYEPDKLQLAAYALLLEQEFSKKIEKGIIETDNNQETIDITEEMKARVLEIAEKIRNLEEPSLPSSFNKCQNCLLKEECFK